MGLSNQGFVLSVELVLVLSHLPHPLYCHGCQFTIRLTYGFKILAFEKSSCNLEARVRSGVTSLLYQCWVHSSSTSISVSILHVFSVLLLIFLLVLSLKLNILSGLRPRSTENCRNLSMHSTFGEISTTYSLVLMNWRSMSLTNILLRI